MTDTVLIDVSEIKQMHVVELRFCNSRRQTGFVLRVGNNVWESIAGLIGQVQYVREHVPINRKALTSLGRKSDLSLSLAAGDRIEATARRAAHLNKMGKISWNY